MSEEGQRLFVASTQVLQLEKKLLYARVTVPPMEDVVVSALADQEVGHLSAIDLSGLDVKGTGGRADARCRRPTSELE